MKLVHSQNRIIELMARFVAEIRGGTAMSRTDLNKTAETILTPLLNEVYGWDLENINYAEEDNNYPGIDLADEKNGVCIQVTATQNLEKIKHTLAQFAKHEQYRKYSKLIIFTLVEKQKSYSGEAIQKIIQNKFEFDPRKAIWDYREILGEVANFQIERALKVQKILEENFGNDSQQSTSPIGKSVPPINWREVSLKVLEAQKQESLTSHVMGAVGLRKVPDVYVPLGLIERKDKPRVGSEINPSQSVMPEKETTVPISHSDFFDGVLKHGKSPSKGRRIAVIGEPGAGKTTLLQTIAATTDGIPIWIELSDLKQGQTLEDFLENHWLKRALLSIREHCPDLVPSLRTASDDLKESLAEVFGTGQVWLLLNGADEMAASLGQPLAWVSEQVNQGWVSQAKVVMSCRLNLWNISGDRLPNFDVYRNLDFSDDEVQKFISQWFADSAEQSSGTALSDKVQKSSDRIRGLVRNPLRLTLLCLSWKEGGERLPETKAGLYQRFVDAYYKWKADKPEFVLSLTEQEQLHQALGDLAKAALEQQDSRFRLRHRFIRQHLETSLFEQAVKLGWLVPVGLPTLDEEHDRDEDVYTFWHPTFQEYFAALVIVENQSYGEMVDHFMFDSKWEEIFILSVEVLPSSDQFFAEMRLKIKNMVMESPKIYHLLEIVHKTFPDAESVRRIEEFRDLSLEDLLEYRILCQSLNLGSLVWLACYTHVIHTALQTYKLKKKCRTLDGLHQNPMNFESFSLVFTQVLLSQNPYFHDWPSLAIAIEPKINEIPSHFVAKMAQLPTAKGLMSILNSKSLEDGEILIQQYLQKNRIQNSRISFLPNPRSMVDEFTAENVHMKENVRADIETGDLWVTMISSLPSLRSMLDEFASSLPSLRLMLDEFAAENVRIRECVKADIERGDLWVKRFQDFLLENEICQDMCTYSEQDMERLRCYFHALLRYLNCIKAVRTKNSTLSVQKNIQTLFALPSD